MANNFTNYKIQNNFKPKENNVPAFNWIAKEKNHNNSSCDVSISLAVDNSKKEKKIAIRFRNNCYKKIAKTDVYIQVCVVGTRLYFRESNAVEGYKLTNWTQDKDSCSIRVPEHLLSVGKIEIGDYNLEYHNQYQFYFIDVKNKINNKPFDK